MSGFNSGGGGGGGSVDIDEILPDQTGNSGEYLTTNGTTCSWAAVAAGSAVAYKAHVDSGSSNLSLAGSTDEIIDYDSEDVNVGGVFTRTTGASFKVTVSEAGTYQVCTATWVYSGGGANTWNAVPRYVYVKLFINGVESDRLTSITTMENADYYVGGNGTTVVTLSAGDYIQIKYWTSNGTAVDIDNTARANNRITIIKL